MVITHTAGKISGKCPPESHVIPDISPAPIRGPFPPGPGNISVGFAVIG